MRRVLRISGSKRDQITEMCKNLHNMYPMPNIIILANPGCDGTGYEDVGRIYLAEKRD
jgi:hypothetical protein